MAQPQAVGIDVGTANCVVARVGGGGHTEIVRDPEGSLRTPNLVLFADQRVYVGEEARLRGSNAPRRLARNIKQELGRPLSRQSIEGVRLPPEVLQACVLDQLRRNLAAAGTATAAVALAVPNHFGDAERQALLDAGLMAGLDVVDLVSEPVAAVLAFGEHTGFLSATGLPCEALTALVYDLGTFSFQATVVRVEGHEARVLAAEHDPQLGGADWDRVLADYLAAEFTARAGVAIPHGAPGFAQLLAHAAHAKRSLGLRRTATVHVAYGGQSCDVAVSREAFGHLTEDLLKKTLVCCERALAACNLGWRELGLVLPVGNATRLATIRQRLGELSGRAPDATVSPDEAVARGAALFAAQRLAAGGGSSRAAQVNVKEVSARGLGIEGTDTLSGKKLNKVLIPRGTPLPAKVVRRFVTKASAKDDVVITVLEGEHEEVGRCTVIGRAVLRDLPADVTGEWPVEVTYQFSPTGRLTVDARVQYTDRAVRLELERAGGVSSAHLRRWKEVIASGGGFSDYRDAAHDEQHEQQTPPIAVAASDAAEPAEERPWWSWLRRFVPYLFAGPLAGGQGWF